MCACLQLWIFVCASCMWLGSHKFQIRTIWNFQIRSIWNFQIRTIWNFQISNVKKIYTFWYSQRLFTNLYTILQAVNYTNWTSLFCSRGFFQKNYFTIQNFKVKKSDDIHVYNNVYVRIFFARTSNIQCIHIYVVHMYLYAYL